MMAKKHGLKTLVGAWLSDDKEDNEKEIEGLIALAKATYKKMVQNLFWATGYNAVAIPLAAGVLFSFGVILNPAVGAGLMSISTVVVAVNARLLKIER
jgi:Cu2+-exporting ATPase